MFRTTKMNASIEERFPEKPVDGDFAYRLLAYVEHDEEDGYDYPHFELHKTEFFVEECGDADMGPQACMRLGQWQEVCHWIGTEETIEGAIARYEYELGLEAIEDDRR